VNLSGLIGAEERIVGCALGLRVNGDGAAREDSFGEHFAGGARALVSVGDDGDAIGGGAAGRVDEPFSGPMRAIPATEDFDELVAMIGLDAGRDVPFGPGSGGVFVEIGLFGERGANAMAAEDDDHLEIGAWRLRGCGARGERSEEEEATEAE